MAHNPDFHHRYLVERLPEFFAISREFDPDAAYASRQHVVVGAFADSKLIGCVSAEKVASVSSLSYDQQQMAQPWNGRSEHALNVYCTLYESLLATYIGAPPGSLSIHSLAVTHACRQRGVARALMKYLLESLKEQEKQNMYVEFARVRWLKQFGVSLGFEIVRKTFSISERLEYGCWGSLLMKYNDRNASRR